MPVLMFVFVIGYMFLVGDSNPNNRHITTPHVTMVLSQPIEAAALNPSGTLLAVGVREEDGGTFRSRRLLILDSASQTRVGSILLPKQTGFRLMGWSGDDELWGVSFLDRYETGCRDAFVAEVGEPAFRVVPCDQIPSDAGPSEKSVTLPKGADDAGLVTCNGRVLRHGDLYALEVCDRSSPQFKDPPMPIHDIRLLDEQGRFLKQYGVRSYLSLVGWTADGTLLVKSSGGLYKIEAGDLR